VGVVPPDNTAGCGAEYTVMTRIVTGSAAYNGTFDATFGRRGCHHARDRDDESGEKNLGSHPSYFPFCLTHSVQI
jgi:hypothetical protein